MRVMGLDPAKSLGWALYDTDRGVSAIECGSMSLGPKKLPGFEVVKEIRQQLPKLIRRLRPDFVAIEEPLEAAPRFAKGSSKKKAGLIPEDESSDGDGDDEGGTTINVKTIALLNRINGAVLMVVLGQNIPCCKVQARTWQTILPKNIPGDTKKRAKAYCDTLKIAQATNVDKRDAALIAIWAAGHAQELKWMERAQA